MTDGNLSPERQRELLAAIGVAIVFHEIGWRYQEPSGYISAYSLRLNKDQATRMAWRVHEVPALLHRITALEAENAALREQAAAPKRVWMLYSSDGYDVFSVIAIYANKESAEKQAGKENADELAFLLEYGDPDCFDHPISEADVLDKRSVKEYEVLP